MVAMVLASSVCQTGPMLTGWVSSRSVRARKSDMPVSSDAVAGRLAEGTGCVRRLCDR